jgi:hypothetical protein
MSAALAIGIGAGLLQVLAYLLYFRQVLRADIAPNGMSWSMWSYGTLVFFVIEADLGAPVSLLILPGVCALCSLGVATHAFLRAAYLPPARGDWAILWIDMGIIGGYVALLYGVHGGVEPSPHYPIGLVFILMAAISSVTSSLPILRSTRAEPQHEQPLAWFVWAAAYAAMMATALIEGLSWHHQLYPFLSLVVHLAIGFFALSGAPRGRRTGPGKAAA